MSESTVVPSPKSSHWPANILLVLAAFTLSFFILELIARVLLPPPQPWLYPQVRYRPDPALIFALRPDQDAFTADKPVVINERGLRGTVSPYSRAPGKTRLLFLGDSIIFGYGVNEEETVTAQTASLLEDLGIPTESINTGVPSYNTVQEVAYLQIEGIQYKPDWVIVGVCWNDINDKSGVHVNSEGFLVHDGAEERQGYWVSSALESPTGIKIRNFIKQSRLLFGAKLGWNAVTSVLHPDSHTLLRSEILEGDETTRAMDGWRNIADSLKQLDDLSTTHGFRTLLVAFPNPLALQRPYPNSSYPGKLRELSVATGIPLIDLEPSFRAKYTTHESLFIPYDGDHPNAAGHKLAARAIADYLITHADPVLRSPGH